MTKKTCYLSHETQIVFILPMKAGYILIAYGLFLIVAGLAGYLSNPEKAKTALMSGGTFGLLQIGLGTFWLKGWKPARSVGMGVASFLSAVFIWRASVGWMAVSAGQSEKLFAAALITSMLVASIVAIVMVLRTPRAVGA
jgi:hypothetical protein